MELKNPNYDSLHENPKKKSIYNSTKICSELVMSLPLSIQELNIFK